MSTQFIQHCVVNGAAIYMLEMEQDVSTCQLKAGELTPVEWLACCVWEDVWFASGVF